MTAHQFAMDGMQACLPEECPLPFTVESATFNKKKNGVLAHVRLFDGLSGTLHVSQVSYGHAFSGWCLQWQELPGGAINWNGERWERHCHTK